MTIDLNADLGEGAGHDAELMALVSSANIACGGHAGDRDTMTTAVRLALRHGVGIGAHPSLPDRAGFGRREQAMAIDDARACVRAQVSELQTVARACGAVVTHVKPHGALYNMAVRDPVLARAIALAVRDCDPMLVVYGLAGSQLVAQTEAVGLRAVPEAFADRTYQANGTLTPRTQPGAVIDDVPTVVRQAVRLIREGMVTAVDGTEIMVRPRTLCVHGEGEYAVRALTAIRHALENHDVRGARPEEARQPHDNR